MLDYVLFEVPTKGQVQLQWVCLEELAEKLTVMLAVRN